jgi:hypothetical protein
MNGGAMVCTIQDSPREGKCMLMNLFTGLFHKRCPFCKQEVHMQGDEAVRRFGKWFCSEIHADVYELNLFEALHTVHCRHAGCHGEHVPLPEAVSMHFSPRQVPELAHVERDHERCFPR